MPSATMDIFKGGRMGGLYNVTGSLSLTSASTAYDSEWSDCAIQLGNNPTSCFYNFYDTTGAPYVVMAGDFVMSHVLYYQNNPSGVIFTLVDGTGRPVIAAFGDGSNNVYLAHNTGSTSSPSWSRLGSGSGFIPGNALAPLDLRVDIAAIGSHTATLVVNDITVDVVSFTDTTVTVNGIQGGNLNGAPSASLYYSQLYARLNGTTVGAHIKTSRATGAGTYQEMAGSYTDVSQQVPNLVNVNTSDAISQRQTYIMSNVTVPTGYLIGGIDIWTQFKNDGTSPENLKSKLIVASTEYDASANLGSPSVGYTFGVQTYPENPNTSAPWIASGWNAPAQAGWTSET